MPPVLQLTLKQCLHKGVKGAIDQKKKSNSVEDEIMGMIKEWKHIGLTECSLGVATSMNNFN